MNFNKHQCPLLNQPKKSIKTHSKFMQSSKEVTTICDCLSTSDHCMTYLPMSEVTRLMHTLHQKIENLIIVVSDYHRYWMPEMEEISRLTKLKWGFLNLHQRSE